MSSALGKWISARSRMRTVQSRRRPRPWFLAQRCLAIAFDKAPLGWVCRTAGPGRRRNRPVAESGVGGEQDLRPLQFSRGMLAATQHRLQRVAFVLGQFDSTT